MGGKRQFKAKAGGECATVASLFKAEREPGGLHGDRRIVFKDQDAETKLCALSVDHSWDLEEMIQANHAEGVAYELRFKSFKVDVSVRYVADPIAECSYAIVSGRSLDETCALLEEKIAHWSKQELFDDWNNAPHDKAQILAILRIGVAAPFDYEESFALTLEQGLVHENSEVREATLAAIGYRDWREFDQLLGNAATNDPEERSRNRAAIMLTHRPEAVTEET